MTVLANATARLNELQAAEAAIMKDLGRVRSAKERVVQFIDMYRLFDEPDQEEVGSASSSATIPEAPKPSPEATDTTVGALEQPAEAKTSAEEPSADGSGGMQDRCESIPPTQSTAARKDVRDNSTGNGPGKPSADPAAATTPQAGTQAPPVDTHPETPAQQPGSEAAVADADPAPAGEAYCPDASPAPISTAGHIGSWVRSIETVEDLPPAEGAEPRAPSAPKDKRPAAPGTLRAKVEADLAEHPNSTSREIADRIGVEHSKVASIVAQNDLPVRKLTTEERRAAQGRRPLPAPAPRPAPGAGSVVVTKPMARAPKGAQFRLRQGRGEGKWLHMSGTGLTTNRTYAWVGTEAQLLKLRQKFPDASDLVEEVVEKEPVRA